MSSCLLQIDVFIFEGNWCPILGLVVKGFQGRLNHKLSIFTLLSFYLNEYYLSNVLLMV